MTYAAFASDVLCHGANFACNHAARMGVKGSVMAAWLNRLTMKPRSLKAA